MPEPMTTVLATLGSRGNGARNGVAVLGLGLAVFRLLAHAIKLAENDKQDGSKSSMTSQAEILYQRVRAILKRIILLESDQQQGKIETGESSTGDEDEEEDAASAIPILHNGSCHCGCVAFELIAPRKLPYRNSQDGRIHYRQTRSKAKNFRFVQGTQFVQMYYVTIATKKEQFACMPNNYNSEVVGAHSFCSRCGVHILHAPDSQSTALDVNIDCLDQEMASLKLISDADPVKFDAAAAVSGQWDQRQEKEFTNHRYKYPTTIQEDGPPIAPMAARSKASLYPRPSAWEMENDPTTIDLLFPQGGKGFVEPDTPSTVYTSSDSFLSSIPPTLTVDTRDLINDTESLASVTSSKSNLFRARSDSLSVGQTSFASAAPTSSSIPSMRANQMKYYMARHMKTSISSGSSKHPGSAATSTTSISTAPIPGESDKVEQRTS